MSFQDDNAQKPEDIPTEPSLGYIDHQGRINVFPKGSNFCIVTEPNPTTPTGKIALVLARVEARKFVFMCGCNQCINSTREDKKNAKVRYLTFTGKWSGVHAHK